MNKIFINLTTLILTVFCVTLAACSNQEMHPRTPAEQLTVAPKVMTKEVESGYILLYLAENYVASQTLPPQIKVNIKSPSVVSDNLQIRDLPGIYPIKLHMGKVDHISIGCGENENTPTTLPAEINATSVNLCGKLSVLGSHLKIKTSHLTMENVDLDVPSADIDARTIELIGENKMTLKGSVSSYSQSTVYVAAPVLSLMNLMLGGAGTLSITADKTTAHFYY